MGLSTRWVFSGVCVALAVGACGDDTTDDDGSGDDLPTTSATSTSSSSSSSTGQGTTTTTTTSGSGSGEASTSSGDQSDPTGGQCQRSPDEDAFCVERGLPPIAYACFLEDVPPYCVQTEETFLVRCCPA